MYIQQHVTAVTSHSPGFDQQHSLYFSFPEPCDTERHGVDNTLSLWLPQAVSFLSFGLIRLKPCYTQSSLSKPVRSIEPHHFLMLPYINFSLERVDAISKRPSRCSSCLTTITFPNISRSSLSRPTPLRQSLSVLIAD